MTVDNILVLDIETTGLNGYEKGDKVLSVGIMRAYPSGARIAVEIWADGHKEADIDRWMENGMTADLTLEQAKELHEMLGEAISKAEKVVE